MARSTAHCNTLQSNARPGHRKLLAQLAALPPLWQAWVCDCIQDMVSTPAEVRMRASVARGGCVQSCARLDFCVAIAHLYCALPKSS